MRVSMKFTVAILSVSLAMSTLALGFTGPVSAEVSQRYLIVANAGLPANLEALVASVGGRLIYEFTEIGVAVAESSEPAFVFAAESLEGIQAVVPDARTTVGMSSAVADASLADVAYEEAAVDAVQSAPTPNPMQWNLTTIKARDAWLQGVLGNGAVVAVLDSGIDAGHPAFGVAPTGQVFLPPISRSFVAEFNSPFDALMDKSEHGTHVAGIIASKAGLLGVAPRAKLVSVKVLKWNPDERIADGEESDIIAGILYAANLTQNGAPLVDVINISAGWTFAVNGRDSAQQLAALNRAINYAHQRGIVVVASVGNGASNLNRNRNSVKAPAEITHVVAVSGTGPIHPLDGSTPSGADTFADIYSDYGSAVYVAAPGGNALLEDGEIKNNLGLDWVAGPCSRQSEAHASCRTSLPPLLMMGTSQAAAHVSGLAALIVSRFGGTASPEMIRAILKASANDLGKPGRDAQYGFGRIDALLAVTVSP